MASDSHTTDIIRLLREPVPMQSCDLCKADSQVFVTCGRGDCEHDAVLKEQAADALEALLSERGLTDGNLRVLARKHAKADSAEIEPPSLEEVIFRALKDAMFWRQPDAAPQSPVSARTGVGKSGATPSAPSASSADAAPLCVERRTPVAYIWHDHLGKDTRSLRWRLPHPIWDAHSKVTPLYDDPTPKGTNDG